MCGDTFCPYSSFLQMMSFFFLGVINLFRYFQLQSDLLKEQILSTQVFMAPTQCIWNSRKMNSTHVHGNEGTCQPRGLGGLWKCGMSKVNPWGLVSNLGMLWSIWINWDKDNQNRNFKLSVKELFSAQVQDCSQSFNNSRRVTPPVFS